jgi:hypothetical protein
VLRGGRISPERREGRISPTLVRHQVQPWLRKEPADLFRIAWLAGKGCAVLLTLREYSRPAAATSGGTADQHGGLWQREYINYNGGYLIYIVF